MPDTRATADGDAFRKHILKAAWRFRLERVAGLSWPVAWGLTGALLVLLLLALLVSLGTWTAPTALILFFIAVGAMMMILEAKVDRQRLLGRMDAQARLPDSVLSTGDWVNDKAADPWRDRQRAETLKRLEQVNWAEAWPVRWPKLLWVPLVSSVLLVAIIWKIQMDYSRQQGQAQLVSQEENKTVAADQLKPIQQVFQDWDEAQKIAPFPEMEELLKEIKPMRDQMAAGQMTEKQLFLKLNDIQARVQAAKDKLEASSLEPMAQSLADAVKDLDGMSGLSAALKRKDFAAAKEQAGQAEKKYQSGAAKMPEGANAQAAASKLGEAAQKASNDAQASSSLNQMQNGVSKKDSSSMGKGLGGLEGEPGPAVPAGRRRVATIDEHATRPIG